MEEQMKATEVSVQKPLKHWHNVALLSHFNCFAVSQTRNNAKDGADIEVGSSKKKTRGGWRTMPYIIGNESCEKLALTGLSANMIVYLTTKYNMQKVAATNVLNIWSGTTSLATLPGAFVADSYLGKFRTIVIGCVSYLVGLSLLTLTAVIPQFRPTHCSATQKKLRKCERASKTQWALLVLVFLFKCIGSAGIKPCSMAFGADQFQQEGEVKDKEEKSKEKKRIESFFNWYYFSSCFALVVALTVIIYIQSNVSWSLGFGICTLLMLISTVIFLVGAPIFLHDIPQGSPFTGFAQVIVASIRKWNLSLPCDSAKLYHCQGSSKPPLTDRFRFLDKAAIITEKDIQSDGSVGNRWRLSSTAQIEALKSIIATLPIFSCGIATSITKAQQHTFSVLQALTMNRKLGSTNFEIPAGSFSVFSLLVLITWLPLYDRLIVPATRRMTKNGRGITVFQRMGIGLAISAISMLVAGFVEIKRRNAARSHGLADDPSAVVPISAFWLVPQFCIAGLGEAFHTVGHLEFFYDQFPPTMRSTAIALSSCTSAIGHYLSTIVVTVVHNTTGGNGKPDWLDDNLNRGYLFYFYWLLSAIEALNLVYFIFCAYMYKYTVEPVQDPAFESGVQEMECKQIQEN
ncbi:hypothetical protein SUGI_0594710 [Cryptomeria japonica]|uniref:protein NRT1/ PTR FAMILY 3.1 n=1 Tax=Cryptomeria japonica TaxID=3369 RepID=UPI002414A253|nr:protein NRT1/ PTR FAMILY 3.1 [Cryptomeria japonica]GLJ30074.1 hypothetical protein SUGI_0594710 [Cryptomeria japonica]